MEAMSAEGLISALWELDGFLARVRWPVLVPNGWSDLDVVAVNSKSDVRLAECKVRGSAGFVFAPKRGADFADLIVANGWDSSLLHIERLWNERPNWLPTPARTRNLEFWFCANVWFQSRDEHQSAEAAFTKLVVKHTPKTLRSKAIGRVLSTRELVLSIIKSLRRRIVEDHVGKRFGHPVLDCFREVLRYIEPEPHGSGRVGGEISEETLRLLNAALTGQREVAARGV